MLSVILLLKLLVFSVVVRGTWFDIFISESWIEAVMLTDCNCEIEHTVSVLTQHFLCGKGSPQTELTSRRLFYFG